MGPLASQNEGGGGIWARAPSAGNIGKTLSFLKLQIMSSTPLMQQVVATY